MRTLVPPLLLVDIYDIRIFLSLYLDQLEGHTVHRSLKEPAERVGGRSRLHRANATAESVHKGGVFNKFLQGNPRRDLVGGEISRRGLCPSRHSRRGRQCKDFPSCNPH